MKRLLVLFIWPLLFIFTFSLSLWTLKGTYKKEVLAQNLEIVAQHQVLGEDISEEEITIASAEAESLELTPEQLLIQEKIYYYLKRYKSPMTDAGYYLALVSFQYQVDPVLLTAIAQCESNLGKKQPKENCHNPFGLGIHERGTLCFNSWEESFEAMARIIRKNYMDKGFVTPDEIMEKYCPRSIAEKDGSWAKCTHKFLYEIDNFTWED